MHVCACVPMYVFLMLFFVVFFSVYLFALFYSGLIDFFLRLPIVFQREKKKGIKADRWEDGEDLGGDDREEIDQNIRIYCMKKYFQLKTILTPPNKYHDAKKAATV